MKIMIIKLASLAIILAGVSGCATVVSGGDEEVTFNSSPSGAKIIVNGKTMGTTPSTITLDRKTDQTLRFELDGYKPYETTIGTTVNGWFFGNVLIGGLLGSTTDLATGAIHQFSQNEYMVALEPNGSGNMNGVSSRPAAEKVREFIVVNHAGILADLMNGEGEYLDSLLSMLKIESHQRDAAIGRLRDLAEVHDTAPALADAVAENLVTQ